MPNTTTLTEEYKRKRLQELGFDPDKFDIDDTAEPIQLPATTNNSGQPLNAFLTAGRRNIGAGVVGLGGTALGAKAGAALGTVVAPGPGTAIGGILGALLGGFGGALLGNEAQSVVEPSIRGESEEATKNRLIQEQKLAEENPISNFAGEAAPMLLGFKPSPKVLLNAIKGGVNLGRLSSIELPLAQKAALINTAANAGISGGLAVGNELADDNEGISIPRVLGQTALGAIVSEPNAIGRRLGFHPTPLDSTIRVNPRLDVEQPVPASRQLQDVPKIISSTDNPIIPPYEGTDLQKKIDYSKAIVEKHNQDSEPTSELKGNITTGAKPSIEPVKFGEGNTDIEKPVSTDLRQLEAQIKAKQLADKPVILEGEDHTIRQQKANKELAQPNDMDQYDLYQPLNDEDSKPIRYIGEGTTNQFLVTKDPLGGWRVTLFFKNKNNNYIPGGHVEFPNRQMAIDYAKNDINKLLEGTPKELPYDSTENAFQATENANEKPLPKTLELSPAEADLIGRENITPKARRVFNNKGEEQAGVAKVGSENREIGINPLGRHEDTVYHEVAHHRLRELLDNGKPADKKLASNLLKYFGGDEEALIQATGEQYNNRTKDFGAMSALKNFFKDFSGGIKGEADRILSAKLRYDAPFSERVKARDLAIAGNSVDLHKPLEEVPADKIIYKGFQDSPKGGFNLYDITEDGLHPLLKKGMTVSDAQLNRLGFKAPDSIVSGKQPEGNNTEEKFQSFNKKDLIPAIRLADGTILKAHEGDEGHFAIYQRAKANGKKINVEDTDGYITPDGQFHNRDESWRKFGVKYSDQIKYDDSTDFYQPLKTNNPAIDDYKPGIDRTDIPSMGKRILSRLNPFNILKSELSRVQEIEPKGTGFPSLSEAINNQRRSFSNYEGQFKDIVDTFIDVKNPAKRDLLYRTLLAENENQQSYRDSLPTDLLPAYDKWRAITKLIPEVQNSLGEKVKEYIPTENGGYKVEMRPRKVNPFYAPNVVSAEAIDALSKPGEALYKKLHDDLIEHFIKHYGAEEGKKFGEEAFREFISNEGHGGDVVKFGPNRKAEGIGLPSSWIERDPVSAMRRYLRRTANDLAFFEHLESDPIIARMIGIERNQDSEPNPTKLSDGALIPELHKNENVRNILDIITGQSYSKTPALDAAIGIVNSSLLGPVSGIADLVSVPFNAVKLAPSIGSVPKIIVDGFKNWKTGLTHSLETGFNKKDPIILRDLFLPTTRLAQKLTSVRDGIYRIQGRKQLEVWSRGLTQSLGESIVEQHVVKAQNGDKNSQVFLRKLLGSKVDFQNIDVKKAASAIGEVLQGTYDFRNLPIWALDSSVAPIFRLARWSIEQTNNWMKYVYEPATKGNFTPLILSTLGAVAGGAVVKQIRESAADKKSYIPSLKELQASSRGIEGNIPQVAYQLLALSTYTGYLGIVSDMARSSLDVMMNHNKPQSVDFPFWGVVSDSTEKLLQATEAVATGEGSFLDTGSQLATDLFKQNFQLARLANTWLIENTGLDKEGKEKRERTEKFRDLRAFKQAEGLEVGTINKSTANPYINKDVKEFKQSRNLQDAIAKGKQITSNIIKENKGNPEEIKKEISSLKRNSYATVPNPRTNPLEFKQYVEFLKRTKGEAAAQDIIRDYVHQNAINRAKSSSLPSLQ